MNLKASVDYYQKNKSLKDQRPRMMQCHQHFIKAQTEPEALPYNQTRYKMYRDPQGTIKGPSFLFNDISSTFVPRLQLDILSSIDPYYLSLKPKTQDSCWENI